MKKLAVLEERLVAKILANPAYAAAFPQLAALPGGRALAATAHKRRCCGRRPPAAAAATTRAADPANAAKALIAGLNKADRDKFKRLLQAENVRVIYRDAKGKRVDLTF